MSVSSPPALVVDHGNVFIEETGSPCPSRLPGPVSALLEHAQPGAGLAVLIGQVKPRPFSSAASSARALPVSSMRASPEAVLAHVQPDAALLPLSSSRASPEPFLSAVSVMRGLLVSSN